jgi:chemotaxis protein MotA
MKAFMYKPEDPQSLIREGVELANIARKEGVLGLEGREISNPFLERGIQLCVDGHEPEFVRQMLNKDVNLTIERHERGQAIFRAIGDVAPAMGMIGTLIGLVQMLSNMDDPKAIGPAMAVALLTTLYGAVIANALAIPIADKLALRSNEERLNKALILEAINAIQEGINPRVMEELLKTYLPVGERDNEEDAA